MILLDLLGCLQCILQIAQAMKNTCRDSWIERGFLSLRHVFALVDNWIFCTDPLVIRRDV